jgi:23S rRNA (cytosine1962-C5)-methyltransferase
VESSANALELAQQNLAANAPDLPVRFERGDVHQFLRHDDGQYDLLIVDPPPLARHKRDLSKATRAYKDSLLFAMKRAAPGAFVLAFACSHTIGPDLFGKVVFGAALDAGRSLSILRTLGPPIDHPVSIDHPEGAYLTGLLLQA